MNSCIVSGTSVFLITRNKPDMSQSYQFENLTVDNALKKILDLIKPVSETESIDVKQAENRILAAKVNSQRDIPRFDNSAMDGYLFSTNDLGSGLRRFKVEGEIRPEHKRTGRLDPGTCKQIMTGAPVPEGNVTVVPIEMIEEHGSEIEVLEIPDRNPIRRQGEGYSKGKTVIPADTLIRPYEVGLMIESGNRKCRVLKKIDIAIQVTGSEIDEDMNSNGPVLAGLACHWPGLTIKQWPVLDDDPALVPERMKELEEAADIVITTGGISMGKHDYVLGAMEKLGAGVIFRNVLQKPGKPFTFTRLGSTFFFHLPGNPISAVFTAEFYVRTAIYKMLGLQSLEMKVQTEDELYNYRPDKTLFVPGKLNMDDKGRLFVSSEGIMKSHLLQLYRNSDVYIRLEPETRYSKGDNVTVIPYSTTRLP
jgi:molybdopterin molybdotransferase